MKSQHIKYCVLQKEFGKSDFGHWSNFCFKVEPYCTRHVLKWIDEGFEGQHWEEVSMKNLSSIVDNIEI